MKMKAQPFKKSTGCSKSTSKRKVHSDTGLLMKQEHLKQPNSPPKELGKAQTKPKVSRGKEMIGEEIKQIKKMIEGINETKSYFFFFKDKVILLILYVRKYTMVNKDMVPAIRVSLTIMWPSCRLSLNEQKAKVTR